MGIENYRRVDTQPEIIKTDLGLPAKTLFLLRLPRSYYNGVCVKRQKSCFDTHTFLVDVLWAVMARALKIYNKVSGISITIPDFPVETVTVVKCENSLIRALKPLMYFGKVIGAVPILPRLRFSAVIILMLCTNVVVELIGLAVAGPKRKTPFDLAASIGTLWFYANGAFVYIHFFRHYDKLLLIMKSWTDIRKNAAVPRLPAYIIPSVILFSAITENMVYHVKLCPVKGENYDFLKCTYSTMHAVWPAVIPYHPAMAVYLIIANKLALYIWNFMDVLIVVLSLGLYSQFKAITSQQASSVLWPRLRDEYDRALEVLGKVEEFLSPLIFVSYGINMFAMCMQLNLWLTPSKNVTAIDSLYSIWSSLHLVARVGSVSYTAAKINEAAMNVLILARECPTSQYTLDIYRLEVTVQSAHVGLSGMKCFFLTKHFMLSIVGVVFTFEVVLLQNLQAC